jgi:hypothetical protein
MPVYRAEVDAGLAEVISATENHVVASLCPILSDDKVVAAVREEVKVDIASLEQTLAINRDQFDLHYLYTILASTGWNGNDDVFQRYEVWAARHTAEDKPFNKQHDPNTIIGHITGNCVVDESYNLLSNELTVDELPTKFHVLTSAVIYKHLKSRDPNLTKATAELIEEIIRGEWFVSMEALFANFDYAMINSDGEHSIVVRDENTSFLSKHLKAYGGKGEYQGYRVGRLMRNMTFSGKGLVKVPGNPESVILDNETFNGMAQAKLTEQGESSMAENTERTQQLEKELAKAQTVAEKLETRLKEMDEAKVQAKFESLEADLKQRDEQLVALQAELDAAKTDAEKTANSLAELEKAKAELDKKLIEADEKFAKIEADNIKTQRISALVDKGVEKADAESLVDTFSGISDEQFEFIVTQQEALVAAKKEKDDKDEKDKDKDKKDKGKGKPFGADADVDKALADAKNDDDPAMVAKPEDEGEAVFASLQNYFSECLVGNTAEGSE